MARCWRLPSCRARRPHSKGAAKTSADGQGCARAAAVLKAAAGTRKRHDQHAIHRGARVDPRSPGLQSNVAERAAGQRPRQRHGCQYLRLGTVLLKKLFLIFKTALEFTAGSFARGLVPRHLAESADPDVRRLYSLWSDTQHEWAATGYDPDFVSDPKAARGPTRGIYLNPGHYKQPGAEGTQLRTEMKPRK
eukprot:COSAG06_NODE_1508_length_9242_cov_28.412447_5_plen_192_part_00